MHMHGFVPMDKFTVMHVLFYEEDCIDAMQNPSQYLQVTSVCAKLPSVIAVVCVGLPRNVRCRLHCDVV